MTVYFIGAGPGDPELITVKGQRLIRACPVILYAGSLVPEAVLGGHRAEQVVNTAELDLDEIVALLEAAHANGQDVARVHSGDPSLYGAIGEQIRRLNALAIPYEIVPGVTAAAASAATLGCELTLPGISQTVILTRFATKTSMPDGEQLADLARHRATMAIHLGVRHIERIVARSAAALRRGLSRRGGVSGELARRREGARHARRYRGERCSRRGIERTALIVVGHVLDAEGFADSSLYRKA